MPKKDVPKFAGEFRELALDMDFGYFLDGDLDEANVPAADRQAIRTAFEEETARLRKRYRDNRKHCRLWLETRVRMQWQGGMLPAQFRLDGFTKRLGFHDYNHLGREWALFDFWQKLERRRRLIKLSWDRTTKIGAVLAILLTLLKLYEVVVG